MAAAKTAQQQLDGFLDEFTPDVAAIARAVLKKLRKQVPPSIELVYDNYNGLVVGFSPSTRPSEAVLSVATFADHVTLCFLFGAKLADPTKTLKGSGNRVRHIRLAKPADLDRDDVRHLIARAVKSGPVAYTDAASRKLVVQSISPKRRPRRPLSA